MLKGLTFNLQTFTSEAFALFNDIFLNKNMGIAEGCELSNTNNSVTIGEGHFVVCGRFLQIISGETISNINTNGYYSLVCEVDLTKTNTEQQFNQGEIKTVYGANAYPVLTQEDLTDGGNIYQYEFARFKVNNGVITDFIDRRTYINIPTLLSKINEEIEGLESQSTLLFKNDIQTITGSATVDSQTTQLIVPLTLPTGWTRSNCTPINATIKNGNFLSVGNAIFAVSLEDFTNSVSRANNQIAVILKKISGSLSFSSTVNIQALVAKTG